MRTQLQFNEDNEKKLTNFERNINMDRKLT